MTRFSGTVLAGTGMMMTKKMKTMLTGGWWVITDYIYE